MRYWPYRCVVLAIIIIIIIIIIIGIEDSGAEVDELSMAAPGLSVR
ncbi:MAG: hypothetical protein V7629_05300 [Motiliproteus sp.]